jgi:hypothetical protein
MDGMAKKKDSPASPPADKPRQVVFMTLDDESWAALESFRASQDVAPERAAVCLKALRQFLTEREFIKPAARR